MRTKSIPINKNEKVNQPNPKQAQFWILWMKLEKHLLQVCTGFFGESQAEAQDALGSAMLLALEKYPLNIEKINNLEGWLVTLTRNVCIDILRKKKRSKEIPLLEVIGPGGTISPQNPGNHCFPSAEECALHEEVLKKIYFSINHMSTRLKETSMLFFFCICPTRRSPNASLLPMQMPVNASKKPGKLFAVKCRLLA